MLSPELGTVLTANLTIEPTQLINHPSLGPTQRSGVGIEEMDCSMCVYSKVFNFYSSTRKKARLLEVMEWIYFRGIAFFLVLVQPSSMEALECILLTFQLLQGIGAGDKFPGNS